MKLNLEDLLDYMDMPDVEIKSPPGINDERIHRLVFEQISTETPTQPRRKNQHRIRFLLIAIAATMILSITAGAAYYFTHTREAALMEAGPIDGGLYPATLDERSQQVIENNTMDYAVTQESGGTSVTLDSVMGFHSEDYSVAYVTVTLALSSEEQAKLEMDEYGFDRMALQPTDPEQHLAGDAAQVAMQTADNSVSVMFAFLFRYQDVTEIPVTLTLQDFRSGSLILRGTWTFDIESLPLSDLIPIAFDSTWFDDTPIMPSDIQLSDFGGTITMQGYRAMLDYKFHKAVQQRLGGSEQDWDDLPRDRSELRAMYDAGTLTDAQYEEILNALNCDGIWRLEVGLEYPDGTTYSEFKDCGFLPERQIAAQRRLLAIRRGEITEEEANAMIANDTDDEDTGMIPFAFLAPQDISEAESLVIEGVKIPLHTT